MSSQPDSEVGKEVLQFALDLMRQMGMKKGQRQAGLHSAVAKMLGRSPAWVTSQLKKYSISP